MTRSALESMQLVVAARRHYLDGATKSAIAGELGVSRFKVARLLEEALRAGVVTIEVTSPSDVDVDLSLELVRRHRLRQALVLRLPDGPATFRDEQFGRAAAAAVADLVEEGDVLGVSWGRTLHAVVQALPALPPCTAVQIVGSVPSADLRVHSLDLARAIAERSDGPVHTLHAPMVVDSPATARRLRMDSQVSATLAQFERLTKALVSIGAWSGDSSSLMLALPEDLRATIGAGGAVADVCATVLDHDGTEVAAGGLRRRAVAITADQLRRVPDVVAVARGVERVDAIAAALRSGLVHRLVTDEVTALGLAGRPAGG